MYKIVFSALILFFSSSLFAQVAKDVFPLKREFKNGGFYISPLATISIGNKEEGNIFDGDTASYDYEVIGRGKWSYGLEVGWYHSFENPRLIHFLEGAISYRVFKGAAEHEGVYINQQLSTTFNSENDYSAQLAVASIRAVHAKQLGRYSFLTLALGGNYNYKVSDKYERSNTAFPRVEEEFLQQSTAQIHFQVGVGFRVSRQLLLIPTIETPLITAYPTDNLNPAFPFFSANYQSIIIGLKFMFLREDPVNCNAPVFEGIPNQ